MTRHRWLALTTSLLLITPWALAEDDAAPRLVLEVSKKVYPCGEAPAFELRWVNRSGGAVKVVRPCDGSQVGSRFPHYTWTLERVDGQPVTRQPVGYCGTVNPLTAADFLELKPGQELPIPVGRSWLGAPGDGSTWLEPGRYRVHLEYAFDPTQLAECYGQMGGPCPAPIKALIESALALTIKTHAVEFEIAAPNEEQAKRIEAWRGVEVGARKAQVTGALGPPDASQVDGSYETLSYGLGQLKLCVFLDKGEVQSRYVEIPR